MDVDDTRAGEDPVVAPEPAENSSVAIGGGESGTRIGAGCGGGRVGSAAGCVEAGAPPGDRAVFVDESPADGSPLDPAGAARRGVRAVVVRSVLVKRLVGAVLVVVVDELDQQRPELTLVPDEGPVQEFVSHGPDPPLREGVCLRCPWWGGDRCGADGAEHVVEGSAVLAAAVVDHEPDPDVEVHQEVAGLLGRPRPGRAGRDPGQMHPSGANLNEEQHIEALEGDGVDAEEVGGDQSVGLAADELRPEGAENSLQCSDLGRRVYGRLRGTVTCIATPMAALRISTGCDGGE